MIRLALLAVASILVAWPAYADNNFGIAARAGTLGIGVEGTWRPPIPWLDFRFGANRYDYTDNGEFSGIPYDGTLALNTFYATANVHFPLSPFRITGGLYENGNELQLRSTGSGVYEIGGIPFDAADVGTLTSVTAFAGKAPYLGFGFDFTVLNKVGLNLDLGVLWQGDPSVSLSADGVIARDPLFQLALEQERRDIAAEVHDYKAWPVATLGIVFNFL